MPFLRTNYKTAIAPFGMADTRGPANLTGATGLPTGYMTVSNASQLGIYRGDAFVIFNPAASTL